MDDLLALSRAEQEHAKMLMSWRLGAHGFTLLLAVLTLWLQAPVVYLAAACALISEGAAWWLRRRSSVFHALAEEGRRRVLIVQHLGEGADNIEAAKLLTSFSDRARQNASKWRDDTYYSATGRVGPERLCEALQESAFWSSRLYGAAACRSWARFVFVFLGAVLIVIVLAATEMNGMASTAARIATTVLAALIGVDELGQALAHQDASHVSDRVAQQLDHINPDAPGQLVSVFATYAVATAGAAPIPTRLYNKHHDVIEEAWQNRRARRAGR